MSFPSFFPSPLSQSARYRPTKFFVGNLPSMASPNDLTMYFSKLGPVVDFHLPATGRHRGFGFVKFKNGFDPYASSVPSMYMEGIALLWKRRKLKDSVQVIECESLIFIERECVRAIIINYIYSLLLANLFKHGRTLGFGYSNWCVQESVPFQPQKLGASCGDKILSLPSSSKHMHTLLHTFQLLLSFKLATFFCNLYVSLSSNLQISQQANSSNLVYGSTW